MINTLMGPEGGDGGNVAAREVERAQPRQGTGSRRVALICRQSLVSDAVRTALASRGFEGFTVRWPEPDDELTVNRRLAAIRPVCVLLMVDLESWPVLREVQSLVSRSSVRWLLLTGTPTGPFWGAMLDRGVDAVLPTTTTLDAVVGVLDELIAGRAVLAEEVKEQLVSSWLTLRAEQELLVARMRSLTPREQTVLRLLYAGDGVRTIAEMLGVSEGTVRSQVKSVLRKLDVNSQLAAVAAFGWLQEDPQIPQP